MMDEAPDDRDDRVLFHAADPDDWERAQALGAYTTSTRDRTLDDEGFVHCSYRHQLEHVANTFYADLPDVVLLRIDRAQLNVPVVDEALDDGSAERFPHVYGPLPVHAVAAADPWHRRSDGRYHVEDVR